MTAGARRLCPYCCPTRENCSFSFIFYRFYLLIYWHIDTKILLAASFSFRDSSLNSMKELYVLQRAHCTVFAMITTRVWLPDAGLLSLSYSLPFSDDTKEKNWRRWVIIERKRICEREIHNIFIEFCATKNQVRMMKNKKSRHKHIVQPTCWTCKILPWWCWS